jgi:APA family basic amino acid/polyamine antiporter
VFTALTYAEGTAMFPEAGGSSSFARHGFNDLVAFLAGWSLMFGYIVTIAISIYTVPHYLAYFFPVLRNGHVALLTSMAMVLFLMTVNVLGVRESGRLNITLTVIDLFSEALLVITALVLFFDFGTVWQRITGHWPTTGSLVFGIAIATVAYTGVESMSQLAGEAKEPSKRVPRAYILMIFTVLILFTGVSLAAFSVLSPTDIAGNWSQDAVAGVANGVYSGINPQEWAARYTSTPDAAAVLAFFFNLFRSLFPILVAIMGTAILTVASNAGLLGISRISYSLSEHHSLPPVFGKVHKKFKTPYFSIIVFAMIAIGLLAQGFFLPNIFTSLGGFYAFGTMMTFALAHASILALRVRKPEMPRPFKLGLNIHIAGREIPITAVLGVLGTAAIWVIINIDQPYSRWFGMAWIGIGMAIFIVFRRRKGYSLTHHVHPHDKGVTSPRPLDSLRPAAAEPIQPPGKTGT